MIPVGPAEELGGESFVWPNASVPIKTTGARPSVTAMAIARNRENLT